MGSVSDYTRKMGIHHQINESSCCQAIIIGVLTFSECISGSPQHAASSIVYQLENVCRAHSQHETRGRLSFLNDSWKRHRWGPPLNVPFWCVALWAPTERLFCEVQEIRGMEVWMCDREAGQRLPLRFVSGHLLGPPNRAPHGRSKHAINTLFCSGFV